MSIPRALTLGFLAAIVLILAVIAGEGLEGDLLVALLSLPVLALAAGGLFERGAAGWPWRTARGLVGGVLAFVAGLGTFRMLSDRTDWFRDVHEGIIVLVFAALAAGCGVVAAAAARPSRGFALASGFILGIEFVLMVGPLFGGGRPNFWGDVGFGLVLGSGALVGALLGRFVR
ncbi:hypothetical protein [Nannocystis punicea]|uniref:Uncharacterized protein n=1 Tax=Nannocystis punicea TaxID=2995304 RepID=A0ABY7HA84_9BACT|nr:hypothetical protein [Nannocystis poenicansa]WAS96010.1 hypothetical protein O0S08_07575 [Nannocystis poenicansa]